MKITAKQIEDNPKAFLERVGTGESIVIVDRDRPVAEVIPLAQKTKALRPFGLYRGQFEVPDDFNDPLPDEIVDSFYSH